MRASARLSNVPIMPRKYVPPTVLRHLESIGESYKPRKLYNLYQLLARLPGQGVGMRIYKKEWERRGLSVSEKDGTYWQVVKTEFDSLPTGKQDSVKRVYGIKYVKGKQVTPPHTIVQIEEPEAGWRVVEEVGAGQTSNTYYLKHQLTESKPPDFGTDVAKAAVLEQ